MTSLLLALVLLSADALPAQASGPAQVVGRVTEWSGCPLEGAEIVVRASGGVTLRAKTNQAGEFRIPDVPRGVARVSVTLVGFRDASLEVVVTAGSNVADTALLLDRMTQDDLSLVEGVVRTSDGKPIPNATVTFMSALEHRIVRQARTDLKGGFTFGTYDSGEYVVTAFAPGFAASAQTFAIGSEREYRQNVRFSLVPSGRCR